MTAELICTRGRDIGQYEVGLLDRAADLLAVPPRWYGSGCAAAGLTTGAVAYEARAIAAQCGAYDVVNDGADVVAIVTAIEDAGEAPSYEMGDSWLIAAYFHPGRDGVCGSGPHVHSVIMLGGAEGARRALHPESMSMDDYYGLRRAV